MDRVRELAREIANQIRSEGGRLRMIDGQPFVEYKDTFFDTIGVGLAHTVVHRITKMVEEELRDAQTHG